jgi:hypothetical protein
MIDSVGESIIARRMTFQPPAKTFAARPMAHLKKLRRQESNLRLGD